MDHISQADTVAPDPTDYRSAAQPIWCPGCGDYAVLAAVTRALAELGVPRHMVAAVSGIGCSSRIPAYTSCYGFHGVHGRALPIASGLKLARPDLTVLAFGGDGDGFSIGGNHFLHACRRNVDITYVIMDNQVYGMTKGQASPTTAADWRAGKLTPEGPGARPIDPARLALACGAGFVARGFAGQLNEAARLIVEGVRHPGFSVIHLLSPCVTFRPEQREWKHLVHPLADDSAADDPALAMARAMADDGFGLGVLFRGHDAPFHPPSRHAADLAGIEGSFAV